MDDAQPLNPQLYRMLTQIGNVKISKQGVKYEPGVEFDAVNKRWRLSPVETGEHYVMTCPVCMHHRPTLYICHRWQTTIMVPQLGEVRLNHAACCYYCHCEQEKIKVPIKRRVGGRYRTVTEYVSRLQAAFMNYTERIEKGLPVRIEEPENPRTIPFVPRPPGVPLQDLPDDHPAVTYLAERPHTPPAKYLGETYGLTFVEDYVEGDRDDPIVFAHQMAYQRLIIPTVKDEAVISWQGRSIDENVKPKYYFPPGPRRFPYRNWDIASRFRCVVLVEGFFDEVAVGPWALTIFGKSLNFGRCCDIVNQWDYIIIALDAYEHQREITETHPRTSKPMTRPGAALHLAQTLEKAGAKNKPICIRYPSLDQDPSSLGPGAMWQLIESSVPESYLNAIYR